VFNAANEECVAAFHARRVPFLAIVDTVTAVVGDHEPPSGPLGLDDVLAAELWARQRARAILER
jgi:1-deoxy-D-xylulose-5-phosphate reductoisomerase